MRALACPASLKGVLSARDAAAELARGLRNGGANAVELPVADGGEGTLDVLAPVVGGEWRAARVPGPLGREVRARWLLLDDGTALVESAEAIGLGLVPEEERDPTLASSRGLGELLIHVLDAHPSEMVVFLGGSATVDGGAGVLDVVGRFAIPVRAAFDVRAPLLDAVRVFARQKGATAEQLPELERQLLGNRALAPFRELPGGGAAGGLGAALAALGADLVEGAPLVLDLVGLRRELRRADLAVTGEGAVDATTWMGKAPGAVVGLCRGEGVRCVLFGGRVLHRRPDVEAVELGGDHGRARRDLVALGERLAGPGGQGRKEPR